MVYNAALRRDRLRTRMRAVNAREVSYTQGSTGPFTVQATVTRITPEEAAAFGVALAVRGYWVIVNVAALTDELGSTAVPERNDEIVDAATSVMLRVVPMGEHPVFRYTNHLRRAFRIHAIEI